MRDDIDHVYGRLHNFSFEVYRSPSLFWRVVNYFFDILTIATTSKTTTSVPTTGRSHMLPPDHPCIDPSV